MAESHVISALTSKRAELSEKIKQLRAEMDMIETELDHLDATIKLFDPDYDLRGIRPRIKREQNSLFKHNELNLLILDVLRQSKSSMTVRTIYDAIIQQKGLDAESVDSKAIQKAIDTRLRSFEKDNTVKKSGVEDGTGANQWSVH